jgi:hypothetical protein
MEFEDQLTDYSLTCCLSTRKPKRAILALVVGLPYRTILLIACLVLAVRYAVDPDASPAGRWIVGGLTAASFALPEGLALTIVGVVLQLGICLFVFLRSAARAR